MLFSRVLLRIGTYTESKIGAMQTAIALPHPHGFGLKDAYKIQLAFDGAPPARVSQPSGPGKQDKRSWCEVPSPSVTSVSGSRA